MNSIPLKQCVRIFGAKEHATNAGYGHIVPLRSPLQPNIPAEKAKDGLAPNPVIPNGGRWVT